MATITRRVHRKGATLDLAGDADEPLLPVLRRPFGNAAVARGCNDATCGSCRVLIDGALVKTCVATLGDVADGAEIALFEDVEAEPSAARALARFEAERPTRCRLCVPALAVTAVALARRGKEGDPVEVEAALEGATCMCTGRGSLRRALLP